MPIILHYETKDVEKSSSCRYWNYRTWVDDGTTFSTSLLHNKQRILCNTRHLAPLAVVVESTLKHVETTNTVLLTLFGESSVDVVSIAGCALSIFGLICIWMMALCCSRWRLNIHNNLLLNICFVLTLIMVYFLFINMSKIRDTLIDINNHHHCVAMGAFLQYTVLVLFIWMLFIGILQYQRYNSLGGVITTTHFVAKYALAAWGLPIVPTILLVYLDPNSYASISGDGICYPSGIGLYITVVMPISLMSITNLVIFCYILCKIRKSMKNFKNSKRRQELVIQVRISILLFLLLGTSWIFGIMAHMYGNMVYSFLFCLTATLQGFLVFIYFSVIEKSDSVTWIRRLLPKDYFQTDDKLTSPLTIMSTEL